MRITGSFRIVIGADIIQIFRNRRTGISRHIVAVEEQHVGTVLIHAVRAFDVRYPLVYSDRAEGMTEGILSSIKSLMETMGVSVEKAGTVLIHAVRAFDVRYPLVYSETSPKIIKITDEDDKTLR